MLKEMGIILTATTTKLKKEMSWAS